MEWVIDMQIGGTVCGNVDAIPVCCGEKKTELEGEALNLQSIYIHTLLNLLTK